MNKLRILHIGNGNAFKINAIMRFFRDRGHDIHFIPMPPPEAPLGGVEHHLLPPFGRLSKVRVLRNIFSIRNIARKLKPDILHCHNARGPGWYGAFSGHHPLIIHAYGGDVLPFRYRMKDFFSKILTIYTCRQMDMMVVTASHMAKAAAHLRIPEDKIRVIPRGVDLKSFRPGLETASLREKLGIHPGVPVIFSPRYQIHESLYNFDVIIKALSLVRESYHDVVCVQLYDGSRKEEKLAFEKMASDRGVSGSYKLVEAVDNEEMPYFYNLADVMVSVPSSDGFPVSVLEASACGTPMIVSELDYTREWFKDEENGILVPVRDSVSLGMAVVKLLKDRSLRLAMIEKNKRQVEEKADYEKCMLKLEELYFKLIRPRVPGQGFNNRAADK